MANLNAQISAQIHNIFTRTLVYLSYHRHWRCHRHYRQLEALILKQTSLSENVHPPDASASRAHRINIRILLLDVPVGC